jgi:hypothetical protein
MNWVLVAFVAIFVSIAALSVASVQLIGPRLPAEARDFCTSLLDAEATGLVVPALWIALRRKDRVRYAVEVALPIGLVLIGMSAAALTWIVWANLDASAPHMLFDSIIGPASIFVGYLAGVLLGTGLRKIAVANRLRRDVLTNRRHVWFGETFSDATWRRATGWTIGVSMFPLVLVLVTAARSSAEAAPLFLLVCVLLGGLLAGVVITGARAEVSVSDSAVKVRIHGAGGQGWNVSLGEIATAAVVEARPERFSFDQRKCILREGSALAITTTSGSLHVVSLDGAAEAASLIGRLRVQEPEPALPTRAGAKDRPSPRSPQAVNCY